MARPKQTKSQLPSLDSGPVPLRGFRDDARRQLIDLIDSKRGKKALVLDPAVSGPLTMLDPRLSDLLTEHGVAKLLYLERRRLDDASYNQAEPKLSGVRPVIYIARATLDNAQLIAWQIKNTPRAAQAHEFSVFWVPRRSVACEKLLEDEGIAGELAQGELPMDLIPLDDDILSLELERPFAECILEGDAGSLYYAAAAIMRLQHEFGLIPRMQGKGPAAAAVKDICIKMRKERPPPTCAPSVLPAASASSSSSPSPSSSSAQQLPGGCRIGRMILIDREVDLVTPMMTQITFEGLIDEVTGIRHGAVALTSSAGGGGVAGSSGGGGDAAGGGGAKGRGASTLLNSSDPYFSEFRGLPYYTASQRLTRYARDARRDYGELGSKGLSELKTFVKGLPGLLLLDRLSDLLVPVAEVVKQPSFHRRLKAEMDLVEGVEVEETVSYIQDLMWSGSDPHAVLRLMVLLSATQGGVPRRHWEPLRQEFVSAYGHQHLLTLHSLESAGLLRAQQGGGGLSGGLSRGGGTFSSLRKSMKLVVTDDDQMDNPTDISHLYKGYAPLTIRMVEAAIAPGNAWAALSEPLAALPGSHFDVEQVVDANGIISDRPHKPAAAAAAAAGAAAPPSGGVADGDAGAAADASSAAALAVGGGKETVLVVFLGGATFSEISALRFLQGRPGCNVRFLALATRLVNGGTLLDGFVDPLVRAFPGGGRGTGAAAAAAAI